jgi:hypothetical protein
LFDNTLDPDLRDRPSRDGRVSSSLFLPRLVVVW